MMAMIGTGYRQRPRREKSPVRLEDLDLEWVTVRNIARVGGTAITAWAGRKRSYEIDLREELEIVAWANRAFLHEILVRVPGEARAHEDVEHVVDVMLGVTRRTFQFRGQGARQVGLAAAVVVGAAE